ncbi:hypothetical protein MKW94_028655, partial [Papaver nudicaule]|nr:hypothetical protein [Papaver nudicaule]
KKQRRIQVLKVSNQKIKSNKNHGKSSKERVECRLRQLKTNRRTKINRSFV